MNLADLIECLAQVVVGSLPIEVDRDGKLACIHLEYWRSGRKQATVFSEVADAERSRHDNELKGGSNKLWGIIRV